MRFDTNNDEFPIKKTTVLRFYENVDFIIKRSLVSKKDEELAGEIFDFRLISPFVIGFSLVLPLNPNEKLQAWRIDL